MPSLTLKDIPLALLERLRAAAARDRRSVAQEVLVLIEGGLAERETAEERSERQIAAWRALAGSWQSADDFEAEVQSILEARSPGRDVDL